MVLGLFTSVRDVNTVVVMNFLRIVRLSKVILALGQSIYRRLS